MALTESQHLHARGRGPHLFPSTSCELRWLAFGPLKKWVGRPHQPSHTCSLACTLRGSLSFCALRGSLCSLCRAPPHRVGCALSCSFRCAGGDEWERTRLDRVASAEAAIVGHVAIGFRRQCTTWPGGPRRSLGCCGFVVLCDQYIVFGDDADMPPVDAKLLWLVIQYLPTWSRAPAIAWATRPTTSLAISASTRHIWIGSVCRGDMFLDGKLGELDELTQVLHGHDLVPSNEECDDCEDVQDVGTTDEPQPMEPMARPLPMPPWATSPASHAVPLAPTPCTDKSLMTLAHAESLDTLFAALPKFKMNHRWEMHKSHLRRCQQYRCGTVHSRLVSLRIDSSLHKEGAVGSSPPRGRATSRCQLHVDINGQSQLAQVVLARWCTNRALPKSMAWHLSARSLGANHI